MKNTTTNYRALLSGIERWMRLCCRNSVEVRCICAQLKEVFLAGRGWRVWVATGGHNLCKQDAEVGFVGVLGIKDASPGGVKEEVET